MAAAPVVVHLSETNWPTLALALTGVVLSLGAIAWQWYSFVFISGSRIKVTVKRGLGGPGAVITFPDAAPAWQLEMAHKDGYTEPVYAIQVNNAGRGSTSITSIDLALSDGGSVGLAIQEPPFPFRLEGEHEQSWYVPAQLAARYAAASTQAWPEKARNMTARGRVTLGSGKAIVSKNALRVI